MSVGFGHILIMLPVACASGARAECFAGRFERSTAPAAQVARPSPAIPPGARPSATDEQAAATLQFSRRAASTVVIRDHSGAPWNVGATLEDVTRTMTAFGADGPLFIRHEAALADLQTGAPPHESARSASTPRAATQPPPAPSTPRFSVGFFTHEALKVAAPYRVEHWSATRTVRLRLDGPSWRTPTAVQRFTEQLRAAGLQAGPDVVEIMDVDANGQSVTYLEAALPSEDSPVVEEPSPATRADGPVAQPAALTGSRVESPMTPADDAHARRSVLTLLERIDQGSDPGSWPDILAPVRSDESSTSTPTEEAAPRTSVEQPASNVVASKTREYLRTGDIKRLAETLLPPGRYSKTRRAWISRLLVTLDDLATTANSPMPTLSRDVARVRRMLKQQTERIKLELPEVTAADMRSRLRHEESTGAAGEALHLIDRLTNDIEQHRASIGEARSRWEELMGEVGVALSNP